MSEKIKDLIKQMTLEEKAGLCSGKNFWFLKDIERLGIPSVMVTDGPHGLRKQSASADHLGINESIPAVCYPAGCASAASFSEEVANTLGTALGLETKANDVSVVLGPAVNIKRSPLCGRNFEYYSEDPYVASKIGTAFVKGVQSNNVGTSVKHFLANNQENRRMSSNSIVDDRALRELYLAAFEGIVTDSQPWTIMCSYNRINGTYACENEKFLTDILRNEWGYTGYVMTDWGAMNRRVEALKAGLELEMPSSNGINDRLIVAAVKNNELDEAILDKAVERILNITYKYLDNNCDVDLDLEKHHDIARELSEECSVLLKNDNNVLPLKAETKVAFVGKYAESPRFQGGGSSHINAYKVDSALDFAKTTLPNANITFAKGFNDEVDETDDKLFAEAVAVAKDAEVVVVFAGLPDAFESEGYDRKHMRMPNCQNDLISEIAKVNKNVVVVLHNGSPVEMPWINDVSGVLEVYIGGEAVGSATVNLLYGKSNPSGKLPETFPKRLQDTPTYANYGLITDDVVYNESIFVGYRYYTTKDIEVLFPFGHGLSYTTFEYSNLKVSKDNFNDTETVKVTVDVTNTGDVTGKEVVQLYVGGKSRFTPKALRELKGFKKIELSPKETKTIEFELNKRSFAYWNTEAEMWYVESGEYNIEICKNAETVLLDKVVEVKSTDRIKRTYTANSTIGDILRDEHVRDEFKEITNNVFKKMAEAFGGAGEGVVNTEMIESMLNDMILRQLASFLPDVPEDFIDVVLAKINK